MNVLYVGLDSRFAESLCSELHRHGHSLLVAHSGGQLYRKLSATHFEIILHELELNCVELEQCAALAAPLGADIVAITREDDLPARLAAYRLGVASIVHWPVANVELLARMVAIVRRRAGQMLSVLQVQDLTFNLDEPRLERAGVTLQLPPTARRLLEVLMRSSPAVVWKSDLQRRVWGEAANVDGSLRLQIHQLRKTIDQPFARPLIHGVMGVGYRCG